MPESFWWWQYSDRYMISLFPHLHTPPSSPSLISLMDSVGVKHHIYFSATAVFWSAGGWGGGGGSWLLLCVLGFVCVLVFVVVVVVVLSTHKNWNTTRVYSCKSHWQWGPQKYISNLYTRPPSRYSNSRNYQLSSPRPKIDIFQTSITFFGASLWQHLPLTVRSFHSLSSFKRNLYVRLGVVT